MTHLISFIEEFYLTSIKIIEQFREEVQCHLAISCPVWVSRRNSHNIINMVEQLDTQTAINFALNIKSSTVFEKKLYRSIDFWITQVVGSKANHCWYSTELLQSISILNKSVLVFIYMKKTRFMFQLLTTEARKVLNKPSDYSQ